MNLQSAVEGDRDKQIRQSLLVIHTGVNRLAEVQARSGADPISYDKVAKTLVYVKDTLKSVTRVEAFSPYLQHPVFAQLAKFFSISAKDEGTSEEAKPPKR